MGNLEQRKLRKEYEQAVASGATREGSMAGYMNERAKAGIANKFTALAQTMAEREAEAEKKRPHTYGEIIKTAKKAKADIEKLTGEPERLVQEKRAELNKEYDNLVDAELFGKDPASRELWVASKIEGYLASEEYLTVKNELNGATNLYAECLALKEKWEQDNADIIEAERVRSKRAELLSADPEALQALGITPVVGSGDNEMGENA